MTKSKYLPLLKEYKRIKVKLTLLVPKTGKPTLFSKILPHRKYLIIGGIAVASTLVAVDAFAATAGLEESLTRFQKLTTGQVATTGFAVVTILAGIRSAMSGSIGLAITSIAIGIGTVFYLDWITHAFTAAGAA